MRTDRIMDNRSEAQMATRRDIEKLANRITTTKVDLLKWIVGLALAQLGVLIGIWLKLAH